MRICSYPQLEKTFGNKAINLCMNLCWVWAISAIIMNAIIQWTSSHILCIHLIYFKCRIEFFFFLEMFCPLFSCSSKTWIFACVFSCCFFSVMPLYFEHEKLLPLFFVLNNDSCIVLFFFIVMLNEMSFLLLYTISIAYSFYNEANRTNLHKTNNSFFYY